MWTLCRNIWNLKDYKHENYIEVLYPLYWSFIARPNFFRARHNVGRSRNADLCFLQHPHWPEWKLCNLCVSAPEVSCTQSGKSSMFCPRIGKLPLRFLKFPSEQILFFSEPMRKRNDADSLFEETQRYRFLKMPLVQESAKLRIWFRRSAALSRDRFVPVADRRSQIFPVLGGPKPHEIEF